MAQTLREEREIPGFNGRYTVNNKGHIKDLKKHQYVTRFFIKNEAHVSLRLPNTKFVITPTYRHKTVARLVLDAFNPIEKSRQYSVVYKDGNRHKAEIDNLEWKKWKKDYSSLP